MPPRIFLILLAAYVVLGVLQAVARMVQQGLAAADTLSQANQDRANQGKSAPGAQPQTQAEAELLLRKAEAAARKARREQAKQAAQAAAQRETAKRAPAASRAQTRAEPLAAHHLRSNLEGRHIHSSLESEERHARTPAAPAVTPLARIKELSPWQEALVWTEVFGPPRAQRAWKKKF